MEPITAGGSLKENVEYGYRLGWSFTPLSGKKPTLDEWQKAPRESLEQALAWASRRNVGLRTGPASGIVVIDVDAGGDISPLDLPGTVTVNTGRSGIHLYYRCREEVRNSAGKLGRHIDVRGHGGQVVYPGSVHPDTGQRYEWAEGFEPWTVEIAELPAEIIERLKTAPPKPKDGRPDSEKRSVDRYTKASLERELVSVATAPAGTRNHALNAAAFNLGTLIAGGYLDRGDVEDRLRALIPEQFRAQNEPTIQSGINSGMEHPRKISSQTAQDPTGSPEIPEGRRGAYLLTPGPHIDDKGEYKEQSSADFACDVLAALPADLIYRKDNLPGEILGAPGRRHWDQYHERESRMLLAIDSHVRLGKWVKSRATEEQVMIYQACSKSLAGLVIDEARQAPRVRELRLMVSYPIYGADWQRVPAGWRGGLFYDEPTALKGIEPILDCEIIHNALHDLVVDFPFKSEADRQNFFGLMLTPIIAPALDGYRPLHMLLASLERTGKSKLAEEVFGGIILGRQTPAMQITERDEERDKRVIGLLLQGETLMHLDNLPTFIDSGTLASLLTATTYGGRLLGGNRMVNLPNNLTMVASGNNVQATGEIIKRTVPILLQPTTASPESRRDFHHPDLRGYVRKERGTILACLLGLVENWKAAGKPIHADKMGGFEAWSGTVGGILQVNGLREWRTNAATWQARADPRGQEMKAFVALWKSQYPVQELTAGELWKLAADNGFFPEVEAKPSSAGRVVAFGRKLQKHTDTPVGDCIIRHSRTSNRPKYRLEITE